MTATPTAAALGLGPATGTGTPVGVTVDGRTATAEGGAFEAFRWGLAPAGLATRRQLRALGLPPAGHQPVAALRFGRGRARVAYLYRLDLAAPKRPATPAQRVALAAAMRARSTCTACGLVAAYCLPTSTDRRCLDCTDPTTATTYAPAA